MTDYNDSEPSGEDYEDACALFEDFHDFPPRGVSDDPESGADIIELDGGDFLVYVGELSRIGYVTPEADRKTGIRENLHTFGEKRKNARPLLYVDLDGQIVVLKGEYTFTEKGFEDET